MSISSLIGWAKPLGKALGIIDQLVVDKDKKAELKNELQLASIEIEKLVMETHQKELATKTVPWVDALHKMGRQLLSYLTLLVAGFIIYDMNKRGIEIKLEHVLAILSGAGPTTAYNVVKGKGRAA